MSKHFEPPESDAPPFGVVEGCARLGFESPLDVRWCRVNHLLVRHDGPAQVSRLGAWKWLFARKSLPRRACSCGGPLPALGQYIVTLGSGRKVDYFLGQCRQCRTIFWDRKEPLPESVR
jgi:hypothetical protein